MKKPAWHLSASGLIRYATPLACLIVGHPSQGIDVSPSHFFHDRPGVLILRLLDLLVSWERHDGTNPDERLHEAFEWEVGLLDAPILAVAINDAHDRVDEAKVHLSKVETH